MLGAHKKPRVVRGSERLATRLTELAGLVLAGRRGCPDNLLNSGGRVLVWGKDSNSRASSARW